MKFLHSHRLFIALISIILVLLLSFAYLFFPINSKLSDLSSAEYYIAHGGGEIDGYTYTNSLEAVLLSIKKGYKYIELDFQLTSDNHLVCMHSMEDFKRMTNTADNIDIKIQDFKKLSIYGKYTPITAEEVVSIIRKYGITLVTDKISDPMILDHYFSKVRKQVMVEAFSLEDYQKLKKLGYTPMLSIRSKKLIQDYLSQCIKNKGSIEYISTAAYYDAIPRLRFIKRLFGVKIMIYVPRSPQYFKTHLGHEIDKIYIDDKDIMMH